MPKPDFHYAPPAKVIGNQFVFEAKDRVWHTHPKPDGTFIWVGQQSRKVELFSGSTRIPLGAGVIEGDIFHDVCDVVHLTNQQFMKLAARGMTGSLYSCRNCATTHADDWMFCPSCGKKRS